MIKSVRKRDGSLQGFEPDKIKIAISKAFSATGFEDPEAPKELSGIIVNRIEQNFPNAIPHIEDIQDIVEHVLIEKGYADVAKAYILYRQKRSEIRLAKRYLGVADDLKLSINAGKHRAGLLCGGSKDYLIDCLA